VASLTDALKNARVAARAEHAGSQFCFPPNARGLQVFFVERILFREAQT